VTAVAVNLDLFVRTQPKDGFLAVVVTEFDPSQYKLISAEIAERLAIPGSE
jgi:hypothetical protein